MSLGSICSSALQTSVILMENMAGSGLLVKAAKRSAEKFTMVLLGRKIAC
jgi:hypothetical protein